MKFYKTQFSFLLKLKKANLKLSQNVSIYFMKVET